jgi:hypothetical protein
MTPDYLKKLKTQYRMHFCLKGDQPLLEYPVYTFSTLLFILSILGK